MRVKITPASFVYWLSLSTLAGCFPKGAPPPAENTPCKTDDGCATGYQCLPATNGASGLFCCKDRNNCGTARLDSGSQAIDGLATVGVDATTADLRASDITSAGGAGGGAAVDVGSTGTGGKLSTGGAGGTSIGDGSGGQGGTSGGSSGQGGTALGGTGGFTDAGVDAAQDLPSSALDALPGLGKACSTDSECALGNCVDGVCCNTSASACGGCNACAHLLTGLDDGTCGPVSAGADPHLSCVDETSTNECGNDGTCDGKGACRKVGDGHVCTPASCSSDGKTFTPAATCNGVGACTTPTPQSCGVFQCASTGCRQTCSASSECVADSYCNTSVSPAVCMAKKLNGEPAGQGSECRSGRVADGVCCDQACSGCSACTLALNKQTAAGVADGQCLPVVAGEVGHGTCTANPPCGFDGRCNGNGGCRYTATGTACGADACSTAMLTTHACDSTHTCAPSTAACPNALACASATACKTSPCSTDGDCIASHYCSAGACTPKKANGTSCSDDNQCTNGHCEGGTCCNSACGQCNSCSTGVCRPTTDLTVCGTGMVCVSGSCITCAHGSTCQPTNPCKTGTTDCSTGTAVCKETGNWTSGHACGPAAACDATSRRATTSQLCDGSGVCRGGASFECSLGCDGVSCLKGAVKGAIYALCAAEDGNRLIRFQASTPGVTDANVLLTGVQPGEYLVGIDFRGSDQVLFGVGATSRVYRIDPSTGVSTAVSATAFTPALEPTPSGYAGVAFIPGGDVLRVMNSTAQNLRVSSTTGAATADTRLTVESSVPAVHDVAYTSGGALYALEMISDRLVRSTDPNSGVLQVVGPLGVAMEVGAFDIGGEPEIGYVVITDSSLAAPVLSQINLATGGLTAVGTVAKPASLLKSIAISP